MIVDSHCHLDFPNLYDNLDSVVQRAEHNKVKHMLTICTTLESFNKIKLIVKNYRNIFGTFGIHPHESKNHPKVNSDIIIDTINNNKKIIGIGETGLDFYYNHSEKDFQKKSFAEHIKAALKLNIPLIVHSRSAEKDTYEMLKSANKETNLKILIHCFTGSKEFAKKLLDINCYISISGIVTFKNSIDLVDTVSSIPIERLLVETDSPYLSPVPYRGKSNEPSFITHTIKKISEIKKLSHNNICLSTTQNFYKLFNIS
jgi:TatD DNase family protein